MSRRKKPQPREADPLSAQQTPPAPQPRRAKSAVLVCALLLVTFALLAWLAARSKSPTYDEPLHAIGAWLHLHTGDFRVNPEDPPLWHYWAALPNGKDALRNPRMDEERFADVAKDIFWEWAYTVETLYRTEGNDGRGIVERSQTMMLIIGVALGVAIAWWSWRLGGFIAAVAATAAFALDPNFLGHSALVKNDVSLTFVMLLLMIAMWRAGQRLTVWNGLAISLLCGAGLNIKFSALLLGPMVLILLLVRAWMQQPWIVLGRELRTRGQRAMAALGACILAAIVSYVAIWATYGFRFRPTPDPNVVLSTRNIIEYLATNELTAKYPDRDLTAQDFRDWRPGMVSRVLLFAESKRLLPQAWINGLLYTQQSAVIRKTFLLGNVSFHGKWYYFPLAMLVKSPIALILATIGAVVIGVVAWRRDRAMIVREHGWTIAAFVVPVGVFLLASIGSNLNIGLRHVLPVYPFGFVAIGVVAAYAWKHRPKQVKIVGIILITLLGAETLAAFPDYLAFFNTAAGGSRGGIRLLGDSNLDWGQDLKRLAEWQEDHPNEPLYLCYFGMADPTFYGVNYHNLPGGYQFGPPYEPPRGQGVIAISATHLQGIYQEDDKRALYTTIGERLEPFEVLGGTIYLYRAADVITMLNNLPAEERMKMMPKPAATTKPAEK